MLFIEPREPIAENTEKILALEKERTAKGLALGKYFKVGWHISLVDPVIFGIIEIDDAMPVAKWAMDYNPLAKVKAVPIVERAEYLKKYGQ